MFERRGSEEMNHSGKGIPWGKKFYGKRKSSGEKELSKEKDTLRKGIL